MQVLRLNNGATEIIQTPEDIANVVYEYLGYDAYCAVHELIQKADREQMKFNSDFNAYEASLESANRALRDISELNEDMLEYLKTAKRIDRDYLTQRLNENQITISNQI